MGWSSSSPSSQRTPRHDHCLGLASGDKVEHREPEWVRRRGAPVSLTAGSAPADGTSHTM